MRLWFQYHLNFSLRPAFFRYYATFFYFFIRETKSFASIEDSLGFSELCDISETVLKRFSIFFSISGFLMFSAEDDGFFACFVSLRNSLNWNCFS